MKGHGRSRRSGIKGRKVIELMGFSPIEKEIDQCNTRILKQTTRC